MARSTSRHGLALPPAKQDLEEELARIAMLDKNELRSLWRQMKGCEAPEALSKDLVARALAHWLQEESAGGLSPSLRRELAAFANPGPEPSRYVKTGSVIVREYQGKVHEAVVVPEGFLWRDQIYASLSTIAKKITGTSWNGPRFFGLRSKREKQTKEPEPAARPLSAGQLSKFESDVLRKRRSIKAPASGQPPNMLVSMSATGGRRLSGSCLSVTSPPTIGQDVEP